MQNRIDDALRYIGIPKGKADARMEERVKEGFLRLEQMTSPRTVHQILGISVEDHQITLEGTSYSIQSRDLGRLLKNSHSCVIMAATLGIEVDRQIMSKQKIDMLEAMILDACASVLIDKVCDEVEAEIINRLDETEYLTMRFSPGYGDVPLEVSSQILDLLDAPKRIGLTLTKSNMLVPTKSVTALIGISNQKENRQKSCASCNLVKVCMYRRKGERCGL